MPPDSRFPTTDHRPPTTETRGKPAQRMSGRSVGLGKLSRFFRLGAFSVCHCGGRSVFSLSGVGNQPKTVLSNHELWEMAPNWSLRGLQSVVNLVVMEDIQGGRET